ncbi:MAG: transketolase [Candidatus Babeliales bacterium]|jgi:transketolase
MKPQTSKELLHFLAHQALNIRIDSLRMTTQAGSGHPTSCLSAADIAATLFFHTLRYDYTKPSYANNDRFILSKGHAIPVVYAALHQLGVISEQQMLSFRSIDSELEGHPTPRCVYNQAATGSLGQGLSIGLGMALNARYEKLSYRTYVMLGDGEMAEGSVWEAAELAAYEKVDNLIAIADCNTLGQSGASLHPAHAERFAKKFEAFGWHAIVIDGHDLEEIIAALTTAQSTTGKPTAIIAKTFKGYGLESIENKGGYHGKPFTKEELPEQIKALTTRFSVAANFKPTGQFTPLQPVALATALRSHEHSEGVVGSAPAMSLILTKDPHAALFARDKKISTRKAFGYALETLGNNTAVFALDADVKNSTYTEFFGAAHPDRFVECFIAEQNMVGVATGLALRGKIPFAATFACFFTRAYDQIRMAGIGRVALRLCGSHTGVSIGQDGPSQMGLEDLAMMRAIPQSIVLWPSDGVSTYKLVEQMAQYNDGVSYMKTTRADTPMLYDASEEFPIGGCKVLKSSAQDQACIVAAGITLHEALKAYELLKKQNITVAVIDLYSIKPLDRDTLIRVGTNAGKTIITVEDHYAEGGLGEAVASALCNSGIMVHSRAVTQLPRSGSPEALMKLEGIDAESIVEVVKNSIK